MGRAGAVAKGGARSRSSGEARGRRPARLSRSELQPEVKPSKGETVEEFKGFERTVSGVFVKVSEKSAAPLSTCLEVREDPEGL